MKRNRLSLIMISLLIIGLGMVMFTNVKGSATTLDFTFEKDILYSESNPVYDSTFNIRNQTEFTGHYPATYSFEGETGFKGENISWVKATAADDYVEVKSEYKGHNEVLYFNKSTGASFNNNFENQTIGTVEVWLNNPFANDWYFNVFTDEPTKRSVSYVRYTSKTYIRLYYGGTYQGVTVEADSWVHVKISIDATNDNQSIWVNGILEVDNEALVGSNLIESFGYSQVYSADALEGYVDAIGYSWDDVYTSVYYDFSGDLNELVGICWDGTYFWVIDNTFTQYVYKYTSEGVYAGFNFWLGEQDNDTYGICWDGTYFWTVGYNTAEVYQYTSSGVYTGIHFDISSQDTGGVGITWDGTYFWVSGNDNHEFYQYTSSGVYTGVHVDISMQDTQIYEICWDGTYIYGLGASDNEIYQYTSLGIYINTWEIVGLNDLYGICWDGTYFWVSGSSDVEIYQCVLKDYYYSVNDNMIPTINLTGLLEVDKYEFKYEGFNNPLDDGDDNPNGWNDMEDGGDDVNWRSGDVIEMIADSGQYLGLNKTDFNVTNSQMINVSYGFEINQITSILNNDIYMKVYSYDSTEVVRIRINDNGDLRYWISGSTYITIDTGLVIDVNYEVNLFVDYEIDVCFLSYYSDGVFNDSFIFPLTTTEKIGLKEISFCACADTSSIDVDLDFIGVYVNGSSICEVFAFRRIKVSESTIWVFDYQNILEYNTICADVSIYMLVQNYGGSFSEIESNKDINGSRIRNLYSYMIGGFHYGVAPIYIYHFFYGNITVIFELEISGVKLVEGVNEYPLDYDYNSVSIHESYFYVDSSNRLQFNLICNDNNSEYIQADFNIQNIATENRSIRFYSNINGNSKGYFALNYESAESSVIEFPYSARTTNIILTQTEFIDSFTILITDNDLDDDDTCEGYITGIRLIYYPDLETTITSLNLLAIIVPLIILIAPPMALQKKFGSKVILPMFILMAIICVATKLIPVWLFFIIAFASIGFIVLKEKVDVGI